MENELLSQIGLEISSQEVKNALVKYFGVESHTKLTHLEHWKWVTFLEKEVKKHIGE